MFQKNDRIELFIEDIGVNGEGIGKSDGFTFFIKDTVPGDRVAAKVVKVKKSYGYGKLIEVLSPSEDRVAARCPVARQCGGCTLQEMSYPAQLRFKERLVKNDLMRLGGFSEEVLREITAPIIGMEEPYRYRNKAQFPVGYVHDRDHRRMLTAGFFAARTHSLIPVEDCLLGIEENERILRYLLRWMEEEDNPPYDEATGMGCVRHVLIRKGFRTGEILVCLVVNEAIRGGDALQDMAKEIPGIKGIAINYNRERTNVILGKQTTLLWGQPRIRDKIGSVCFEISPESFFQVNPVQTEQLYNKALEYAGLTGCETVWDLYCGIGTISLFLAKRAKAVYGVEVVPQAVEDAKRNAMLNGMENTTFFSGRAEELMPKLASDGTIPQPDVIVVDPPRKGCDSTLLETMCEAAPQRIVYISCDPATLARDLRTLTDAGYELRAVTPVDMFPQTRHVETVCILSKLSSAKEHIEVTVDMDELDLTSAEAKATYNEIRNWVQEHYGMHVTNLNIAQVKQKNGIIERENYNKPKSPDSKQPQCPEEKIKAIEAAMRHFQMI